MQITAALDGIEEMLVRAAQEGARVALREHAETGAAYLDVRRAAEYLSTTPAAIRALIRRDRIPHHRVEGRILFSPDELRAWVEGGGQA